MDTELCESMIKEYLDDKIVNHYGDNELGPNPCLKTKGVPDEFMGVVTYFQFCLTFV